MDKNDTPTRSPGEASRAGLAASDVAQHQTTHAEHGEHAKRGLDQAGLDAETPAERHNSGELPYLKK